MSGKRRRPWIVRVTTGYDIDAETGTFKQKQETLGYAATRTEGMQMLAEAQVEPTMIKKIVGHSGAMTLTERVYTHLDVKVLLEAINKI